MCSLNQVRMQPEKHHYLRVRKQIHGTKSNHTVFKRHASSVGKPRCSHQEMGVVHILLIYKPAQKKENKRWVLIFNRRSTIFVSPSSWRWRQWGPWNHGPSIVGQVNRITVIYQSPTTPIISFFTSSDSFNLCSIILEVRQSKLDAGVPFITPTFKKTLLVFLSAAKQQNDILTEQPTHPKSPPTPDIFFPKTKKR